MISRLIRRRFSAGADVSYVHGSSLNLLIGDDIGAFLNKQAHKYSARPYLFVPQEKQVEYTYKEINQRVTEVAKGLLALGLEKGDRVGVYAPNRSEWTIAQFACSRADLILVNVNPAFQAHELDYCLTKVGMSALIMSPSFKASNYVEIVRSLLPDLGSDGSHGVRSDKYPKLRNIVLMGD